MNTTYYKWAGFLRGLIYPILATIIGYIINNLGGSGLVSAGTATLIVGILGIVDSVIEKNGSGAVFGVVK